jgi:OmcA/MtrC family decaheme c-type cytochrome
LKVNSKQALGISRPSPHWIKFAAAGLLAAAIAGCGGGSTGANTTVATPTLTSEQWAAASLKVEFASVAINASAPVVNFKVRDSAGKAITGLTTGQLRFTIAKLVDSTNNSPTQWVSYIVASTAGVPSRPTTENVAANLIDNKDGSYTYTFSRDITGPYQGQISTWFNGAATRGVTSNGVTTTYAKADVLGADGTLLNYDPALPHRVAIQLSGSLVTGGLALADPVNAVYDFVPNTGPIAKADLKRDLVNIDSCNSCHEKLAFHGGGRDDTKFCVTCHTDQRRIGYTNVASTAGKFPALKETAKVDAITGITSYTYAREDAVASSYVYDGEAVGNFVTMIHKIHQGTSLVKDGYNYANVAFNNKGFSKLNGGQKMCTTCHSSNTAKVTNVDNWNTKPSRQACGACHDGINFATGLGSTLANKAAATAVGAVVATSNHLGGTALLDDSTCAGCHTSTAIKTSHQTENITPNNPTVAAGLVTFTYEIKSAKVESNNNVTIEFGLKQKVSPSSVDTAVTLPLTGFTGGPSFLFAYATPQDGIDVPVDFNNSGVKQAQAPSVTLASLLATAVPSSNAGYYIATVTGNKFPVNSKMRTVALQGYYSQTSAPGTVAVPIARHAVSVVATVTGDTVRRTVVDDEKCSNCHEWFEGHGGNRVKETQVCVMCHTPGLATSGRGVADSWMSTKVFDAASTKVLAAWQVDPKAANAALKLPVTTNNFKDMIHGIHAGRDRVTPFVDARDSTSRGSITLLDLRRMDFPGVLSKCSACHTSPSPTSSTTTYNTVPSNVLLSTYESVNLDYATAMGTPSATTAMALASLSSTTPFETDLVTTPYAAACVTCHDNRVTNAHVVQNGGMVKVARSAAKLTVESCATCHGPGRTYDAAVVHK